MTNNYIKLSEGSIIQTDDILRVSSPKIIDYSDYSYEIRIVWANKCVEIIKYYTKEVAMDDYNLLMNILLESTETKSNQNSLICD